MNAISSDRSFGEPVEGEGTARPLLRPWFDKLSVGTESDVIQFKESDITSEATEAKT